MIIQDILEKFKNGEIDQEQAVREIKHNQYEDLGYAKIDHNRKERSGNAEVVFCQGKPDEFLVHIYERILKNDGEVLGTRASKEQYELVRKSISDIHYNDISRILKIEKAKDLIGNIAVCTGGTSDIPVAEEAAETAEFFGSKVERIYDVGVAGIHRLLAHREKLEHANVIVVVAGMEGALASVVAGLSSVPVIAVPTSVGYGASFGGLAALLSMLNSCSNGVSVVNIDNGYGAGYIANQINQAISKAQKNRTKGNKIMADLYQKEKVLEEYLKSLGSVAVAFSSGVDSTYLLAKAKQVLGDQVIAVTARSCSFPKRELDEASAFCEKNGIRHIIVDSEELQIEGFSHNPRNRCYLCKKELFEKMIQVAKEEGMQEIVEGSNIDDMGDYRPGLQAIAELKIKSPLRYADLHKEEIRELSRDLDLPTWDKQSFACLSSRFVYGETITEEKLAMVDKAEQFLLDMGLKQIRVRIHGEDMARIEVRQEDIKKLTQDQTRADIVSAFQEIGFHYITLDLQGYRMGSMNNFKD